MLPMLPGEVVVAVASRVKHLVPQRGSAESTGRAVQPELSSGFRPVKIRSFKIKKGYRFELLTNSSDFLSSLKSKVE
jgi:hypothetical protein